MAWHGGRSRGESIPIFIIQWYPLSGVFHKTNGSFFDQISVIILAYDQGYKSCTTLHHDIPNEQFDCTHFFDMMILFISKSMNSRNLLMMHAGEANDNVHEHNIQIYLESCIKYNNKH